MAISQYDDDLEQLGSTPRGPATSPLATALRQVLDEEDQQKRERLSVASKAAATASPDRAAEVDQLARRIGTPAGFVERNFDAVKKHAAAEDAPVDAMLAQSPHLAEWASEPSNHALAKDDLEQLGFLEWIVTAPQRAFAQSANQMRLGELRSKSLFEPLTQQELDLVNSYKFNSTLGGELGARESWFRGAITGSGQFLANVGFGLVSAAPQVAIGTATGAVIGGVGGFLTTGVGAGPGAIAGAKFGAGVGGLIGGGLYTYQVEAGLALDEFLDPSMTPGPPLDPDVAKAAALAAGAINAGLEVGGLAAVFKTIPGLKQLGRQGTRAAIRTALRNPTVRAALGQAVKEYGKALTAETSVEVAQRAVTILAGELGKVASGQPAVLKTPEAVAADLVNEGAGALQSFALGLALGPGFGVRTNLRRAQQATQNAAIFAALADGATNSKTIARAPEAARAFIAAATKDGPIAHVYIPVAPFAEYYQSQGLDPTLVADELTGTADALERARATGEDLRIPTATYAVKVAGTPHHVGLARELRFAPDQMNAREADVFAETLAQQAPPTAESSPAAQVREQVEAALVKTGIAAKTAHTYAVLYEAALGTMAKTADEDPLEVYQRYGLQIVRPDLAPPDLARGAAQRPETPPPAGPAEAGAPTAPPAGAQGVGAGAAAPGATQGLGPEVLDLAGGLERAGTVGVGGAGVAGATGQTQDEAAYAASLQDRIASALAFTQTSPAALANRAAGGVVDTIAETGDTTAEQINAGPTDAPLTEGQRPAPARGVAGPGAVRRPVRRRADALSRAGDAHFPAVVTFSRAAGWRGTTAALRIHYDVAVESARSLIDDLTEVHRTHSGTALLKAIRAVGGLKPFEKDVRLGRPALKLREEFIEISQNLEKYHGMRGAAGIMRNDGRGIDGLLQDLQQGPGEWVEFETTRELWDAIVHASGPEMDTGTAVPDLINVLEGALQVKPEAQWWPDTAAEFDVAEFRQSLFDELLTVAPPEMLPTGEQQPALPGDVGAVRQAEIATPAFDAPFALTPERAKGPTGTQTTLFQSAAPFYSALTRAAEELPQAKGTPEQMLAMLTKGKGVKAEEIKWSGVEGWLKEQRGSVTREALVDYLRANELHVEEVLLGGASDDLRVRLSAASDSVRAQAQSEHFTFRGANDYALDVARGDLSDSQRELMSADMRPLAGELRAAYLDRQNEQSASPLTKFSQWQVPGGENYRELLITLPGRLVADAKAEIVALVSEAEGLQRQIADDFAAMKALREEKGPKDPDSQEYVDRYERRRAAIDRQREISSTVERLRGADGSFRGGHFEEPNVVAHLRFNDRTSQDGKKILFVEEVQSDWHEQGRKKGYKTGATERFNALREEVEKRHGKSLIDLRSGEQSDAVVKDLERIDEAYAARTAEQHGSQVPDAPFKTTWAALAMKRAIRYAAEHGYAAVAWTPGEVQNERYDLSKHIDELHLSPQWSGMPTGNAPETYLLIANKEGQGTVLDQSGVTPETLADYVGKDAAEKLLQQTPDQHGTRSLEGVDLKVGGKGMIGFYDQILPAAMNKFGKPFGAKVGETQIEALPARGVRYSGPTLTANEIEEIGRTVGAKDEDTANGLYSIANRLGRGYDLQRAMDEIADAWSTDESWAAAKALGWRETGPANEAETATVHSLDLTPALKDAALGGLPLFQRDKAERRGSLAFGSDRQMTINLFAQANLSTFLHESGHFFLETFGDLVDGILARDPATLTGDQRRMLADYGAIFRALGVTERNQIGTAQHEQFARMFEKYLMEGQAPSLELRAAFARFRAWLLDVYRFLRLNVPLSDEVRGVFDRMLASDAAIAEAEAAGEQAAMFTTAESAGMTPERFDLYRATIAEASRTSREQLEQKALGEIRREQTALWTEQRAAIETEVAAEVHARPIYRAIAAMQRGTLPDGTPIEEGLDPIPMKLDRAILVERYGKDFLKTLPRPYVYTVEGGLDPEPLAGLWGFSSGDELVRAVAAAVPMRQAIAQETDARMQEAHGSMLLDGTLQEQAQAAVLNEDRDLVVRAELWALSQLRRTVAPFVAQEQGQARTAAAEATAERTYERRWFDAEHKLTVALAEGRKQVEIDALREEVQNLRQKARGGAAIIRAAVPPASVFRTAADARIAATVVRDINPLVYWSAARRASIAAREAAARQDFDAAITAAQQELFNLALHRAATAAREDVETRVRRARAYGTPAGRARLGTAGEAYLDQVDGILDRYEFAPVSQKALDRRANLRRFVAALEGEGLPIDLPDVLLDETQRIHYRELSYEALVGVTDGLEHLVHVARLKNRLLKQQAARELAAVTEPLAESIHTHNAPRRAVVEFDTKEERRHRVSALFGALAKVSMLAQMLDGYVTDGPMSRAIVQPLNAAADWQAERKLVEGTNYAAIVQAHYSPTAIRDWHRTRFIPAIGASLSTRGRLAVALNWGTETNRDRLLHDPVRRWSRAQIEAILDTLDARDWAFVQATWDYNATFRPEVGALEKQMKGVEPEWVEPLAVETKFGTFAGGYYPIAYDRRLARGAAQVEALQAIDTLRADSYVSSTTRQGHLKARQARVTLPLKLDLSVEFQHIDQVIHDLAYRETLFDIGRILRDKGVAGAIYATHGDATYDQLTDVLKAAASGLTEAENIWEQGATWMKTGGQIAALGLNVWTAAQQPLGLFNGMAQIGVKHGGPKWIIKGAARWLVDAARLQATTTWIVEVSPFMRNRRNNANQDLSDVREALLKPGGWFDAQVQELTRGKVSLRRMVDAYMYAIVQMQRVADVPTWLAGYEKAKAEGLGDAEAYVHGDQLVRDAQGSAQIHDLSRVQRGGPVARLFMMFYSYGNTVFNTTATIVGRTSFRSPSDLGAMVADLSLLYVMPAFFTVMLARALGKDPGRDDEDWSDWVRAIGRESLATAMNTVVGLRELGGLARGGNRGYSGPAGTRLIQGLYDTVGQVEQGEVDAALWRSLNTTLGIIFRYPAVQVQKTIDGAVALSEEKTSNPGALLVGAPPRKKSMSK